jgi:hypothetical protein
MQPPVLAEAVAAGANGPGGEAYLREVLPGVRRYFDWLDRMRDPDRDGLIATLQPDESGLDHTPKYDDYLAVSGAVLADYTAAWERVADPYAAVQRDHEKMFALDRFVDEDVFVNTIYAENQRVLGDLLERIGEGAGAQAMRARAAKTSTALIEKCFDEASGLFFDLAGRNERMLKVNTVSSLVPILLTDLPPQQIDAVVRHIEDPAEYAAPYPVPSVAMNEPSYLTPTAENKLVWRGPTWINANWYIARGLRRHGRADLARQIEDRSAALVEGAGFREYYDPRTGE